MSKQEPQYIKHTQNTTPNMSTICQNMDPIHQTNVKHEPQYDKQMSNNDPNIWQTYVKNNYPDCQTDVEHDTQSVKHVKHDRQYVKHTLNDTQYVKHMSNMTPNVKHTSSMTP